MKIVFTIIVLTAFCSVDAQLRYEDHFDTEKDWSNSAYANYQNGAYHIFAKNGRWSINLNTDYDNFTAEIKTEFLSGSDDRGYGLIFRARDIDNFYAFCISAGGYYLLGGQELSNWFNIIPWKKSDLIQLNGVNFLRIDCKNDVIKLYINGTFVDEARHPVFKRGRIGFVAYDSVHAHFDDIKVYAFGSAPSPQYDFAPENKNSEADFPGDPSAWVIENFYDKSVRWLSESEFAHYEKGYYAMADPQSDHFTLSSGNEPDFIYEVNFRVSQWAKDGAVGLLFRMSGIEDALGFYLTDDGNYYIDKRINSNISKLHIPTPVTFEKSGIQNLKIIAEGAEIVFILNGTELTRLKDITSSNGGFGFFTSKGLRADFLSVKINPVPFSFQKTAIALVQSLEFWVVIGGIGLVVVVIIRSRSNRLQSIRKKRENEIFDLIKNNQGTLRLGDVMMRYRISKNEAQKMLENLAKDYGGQPVLSLDGSITYDFPELMPSEDKLRSDVIQLAAMRKGRLTVTDTANFLKKDLTETEVLLDTMLDGYRVKKNVIDGITYYEFTEILSLQKKR
ncbi:hypothetical protein K1X84_16315 [bacterium]|nr:hypothetical protein [bacterium]